MSIRSYHDSFLSLVAICTLLLLTISSCELNSVNNADNSRAWVSIDPIQCLGNPWEQDWLKKEDHTYEDYPKGDLDKIEDEEFRIIQNYYQKKSVEIHNAKIKFTNQAVCNACSCPEGTTLYLQTDKEDMSTMINMGFRENNPPEEL